MRSLQLSGTVVAALFASAAIVLAQPAPTPTPTPAPAASEATPRVAEDRATHIAMLGAMEGAAAAGTGTAWLRLDPQNNTLEWTVDFTDFTPVTVVLVCGDEAAPAATPAPATPPAPGAVEANPAPAEGDVNLIQQVGVGLPIDGAQEGLNQDLYDEIDAGECRVVATAEGGATIEGAVEAVPAGEGMPAGAPAPAPAPGGM
jgi:hypothetical protein